MTIQIPDPSPVFRCHLKSELFHNWTIFHYLNTGLLYFDLPHSPNGGKRTTNCKCNRTWLTELSAKLSSSSTTGAAVSRDLKNFLGFGAPTLTGLTKDPRFRSELDPNDPTDVDDGRMVEKLPHLLPPLLLPKVPLLDFETTAGKDSF